MGMYDKLGDLLSETLEAGKVKFVKVEKKEEPSEEEKLSPKASSFFTKDDSSDEETKKANAASEENARRSREERERIIREQMEKDRAAFGNYTQSQTGTIFHTSEYKSISPEVEAAFKLLGLETSAGENEIKTAYREKLRYYHPDHNNASQVLEKVAADKTRQVLEAYRLALEFCKK